MQRLLAGSSDQIALAYSMIEAAGVVCEIRNEGISQAMIGFPFQTELWVQEQDVDEARQLISRIGGASSQPSK